MLFSRHHSISSDDLLPFFFINWSEAQVLLSLLLDLPFPFLILGFSSNILLHTFSKIVGGLYSSRSFCLNTCLTYPYYQYGRGLDISDSFNWARCSWSSAQISLFAETPSFGWKWQLLFQNDSWLLSTVHWSVCICSPTLWLLSDSSPNSRSFLDIFPPTPFHLFCSPSC